MLTSRWLRSLIGMGVGTVHSHNMSFGESDPDLTAASITLMGDNNRVKVLRILYWAMFGVKEPAETNKIC